MAYPAVQLVKPLERAVRHGHPWLYQRALAPLPESVTAGQLVRVVRDNKDIAIGYAHPDHAIGVRVLSTSPADVIDAEWIRARAARAARVRVDSQELADTNAFRIIHGENDAMPGLVVDCYAGTAVVVFDGAAAQAFWQPHLDTVLAACREVGATIDDVVMRPLRGTSKAGVPVHEVQIKEGPANFFVDVRRGQKTGFFLDQRNNRSYVAGYAKGASVLNLFAYTGGFSVHAALAGARRVTTLDQAKPAIETARRNFELNGINEHLHGFIAADAFDFLAKTSRGRQRFDIVICDPPSFAPSAKSVPHAVRAYTKLNAAALSVVKTGGLLATASCSSHLTTPMLSAVLAEAARQQGRTVRTICTRGHAIDHPTLPGFPEGNYLSFLFVAVD